MGSATVVVVLEPGTPVSFDVLMNEIRGLAINMVLNQSQTLP